MTDLNDDERASELPAFAIVRKDSIEQLVGHRNRALELARQALTLLAEGESAAKRAAQSGYDGFIDALVSDRLYNLGSPAKLERLMQLVQGNVDQYAWSGFLQLSGLSNLMDSTAHEQMRKQLSEDPQPFTLENVLATYAGLVAQAPSLFHRSVVNVFRNLNTKDYKTNSAFRFGPRIILTRVFDTCGSYRWGGKREEIGDLDRIFHILDGKKPSEAGNTADLIEAAFRSKRSTCTTEYFDVRMFSGNGNLHLTFRRRDLLDRANDIIARQYDEALADDAKHP